MIVTWRELRGNLADIINRVRYSNERVQITRHGKVVAELVPTRQLQESQPADPTPHSRSAQPLGTTLESQGLRQAAGR